MTVLSSRPISMAHWVAFLCWRPIIYNAKNRSRVRGCSASTDSRRKSASVWPHFSVSGRIIFPSEQPSASVRNVLARLATRPQNYESQSSVTLVIRAVQDAGNRPSQSPMEILKRRYASGEIDDQEYENIRQQLQAF